MVHQLNPTDTIHTLTLHMSHRDPAKRIPKFLGTEATLFGTYTLSDAAIGLFPGVVVVLLLQVVLPDSLTVGGYALQTLTLPLAGGAIVVGAVFVYLTPSYTTSIDWITTYMGSLRAPDEYDVEAAKEQTQLERLHPEHDAIERTDGAFVGMVQVDPPNMALATSEEWQERADAFADVLNTTVEFPVQLYSTTQDFPVEEYLAHYDDRLDDPDVKANPRLAGLIEAYTAWYEDEVDTRQMTIRDHYVIVAVTPREVQFDSESLLQQLAGVPILGLFITAWFAPRLSDERQAMFDELDSRLRRVEGGIREIDGCDVRRLDAHEALGVVGNFWTNEGYRTETLDQLARRSPIVSGGRR
ncbi:hypothetical protein ACFQGE_06305 [Halomicroarcula sp. GCM10025817]|uniref:hypothetical protein n=1 Tax=Haloarcula TaxID=2237 RepID=UPI0023E8C95A|nr:hypothetical protein [Halomicroarcula sp. SYNS111]